MKKIACRHIQKGGSSDLIKKMTIFDPHRAKTRDPIKA
jgi:hypothetical protein